MLFKGKVQLAVLNTVKWVLVQTVMIVFIFCCMALTASTIP